MAAENSASILGLGLQRARESLPLLLTVGALGPVAIAGCGGQSGQETPSPGQAPGAAGPTPSQIIDPSTNRPNDQESAGAGEPNKGWSPSVEEAHDMLECLGLEAGRVHSIEELQAISAARKNYCNAKFSG